MISPPAVKICRCLIHQVSGIFDLNIHIDEFMLDGLETGNRLIELFPLFSVRERHIKRALGETHGLGGDLNFTLLEKAYGLIKAVALLTQKIFRRHFERIKKQFGRTRQPNPQLFTELVNLEIFPDHASIHDQNTHSLMPRDSLGICLAKDRKKIGGGTVGDKRLGTGQAVMTPISYGDGIQLGDIAAMVRLRQGNRSYVFSGDNFGQILLFLKSIPVAV